MFLIITLKPFQDFIPHRKTRCSYFASLELLKNAKKVNKKVFTKSGIMVGLVKVKKR